MSRLSSDHYKRLLDALTQGFSEATMRNMLRTKLGKDLAVEAGGNGLEEVFGSLIRKAEERDWVFDLVRAASDFNPTAALQKLADDLVPQIRLGSIDHFNVCFVGSERIMINRRGLRQSLKTLSESIPKGKRILVVNGPPVSGKTYSFELITYLREALKSFKLVQVELTNTGGQEVKPEDIAWPIVEQMNLDDATVPSGDKEQDSRWVRRFCDRLTGRLNDSATPWWLVIDGFNYVTLSQPVKDLVGELATRISKTLPGLRMVLLGYEDNLPLDAQPAAIYDTTGPIGDEDLTSFFYQVYQEHNVTHFPLDIAQRVAEVLRAVNPTDKRRLETLSAEVSKVTKSITGQEVMS